MKGNLDGYKEGLGDPLEEGLREVRVEISSMGLLPLSSLGMWVDAVTKVVDDEEGSTLWGWFLFSPICGVRGREIGGDGSTKLEG